MSNLKLKIGFILTIIALGYLFPLLTLPVYSQSSPLTFSDSKFNLFAEWYGPFNPTVDPSSSMLADMANRHKLNGIDFNGEFGHVPISTSLTNYLSSSGFGFIDHIAGGTKIWGDSQTYIAG